MPPKSKITKEMVIDAAFSIARETGWENISARAVAKRLKCSTQPVMYCFSTVEELKKAAYERADSFHTEYLMRIKSPQILLEIGLNYIGFAAEEPRLFRFLFQSNYFTGLSIIDMIDADDLSPVLTAMQQGMNLDLERTKEVFVTLFMFVHGYASLIANNSIKYDEKLISRQLERVYRGAVMSIKEETR